MIDVECLARYARARIAAELGGGPASPPRGNGYDEEGAAFVTLRFARTGELHGCIGSLTPRRSLATDVAENAIAAAFHDPRGGGLSREQLDDLDIEVSVLSPLEAIGTFDDEAKARNALRLNIDGVVLRWRSQRGTFLPQMWERLTDSRMFLDALKEKAGLKRGFWDRAIQLERYTVTKGYDRGKS